MYLTALYLVASTAAYNSGTIADITPEFINDFKKSRICELAPDDAMSVHYGELAIYVVRPSGMLEVLQDGFANRFNLDYCSQ